MLWAGGTALLQHLQAPGKMILDAGRPWDFIFLILSLGLQITDSPSCVYDLVSGPGCIPSLGKTKFCCSLRSGRHLCCWSSPGVPQLLFVLDHYQSLPFQMALKSFFSFTGTIITFQEWRFHVLGSHMWVSGPCWMRLDSWERGRWWLGGNLELILGQNTDVHGVTPSQMEALPWCWRKDFI